MSPGPDRAVALINYLHVAMVTAIKTYIRLAIMQGIEGYKASLLTEGVCIVTVFWGSFYHFLLISGIASDKWPRFQ